MKQMKWILLAFCLIMVTTAFAQTASTTTFKVFGNCSTCKKHIETAALAAGAAKADWNKDTKMLTLVYDPAKTNVDNVQKHIAAAGYDTPKFRGDDKAYGKLDECCQYDRKTAN